MQLLAARHAALSASLEVSSRGHRGWHVGSHYRPQPAVPWCSWPLSTAMHLYTPAPRCGNRGWLLRPARLACLLFLTLYVLNPATLPSTRQGDGFPELRATLWQSEGSVAGAVQGLVPQMTENRKKVRDWVWEGHVQQQAGGRGFGRQHTEPMKPLARWRRRG